MWNKNELEKMVLPELLIHAKDLNIKGRHDLRKSQLIDSIIDHQQQPIDLDKDFPGNAIREDSKGDRSEYVDNVRVGTLIAFRVNDKKALSGKVQEIHGFGFWVETKNGIRFKVRKANVMWVKTGDRWPKGVYLALKGENELVEHKAIN